MSNAWVGIEKLDLSGDPICGKDWCHLKLLSLEKLLTAPSDSLYVQVCVGMLRIYDFIPRPSSLILCL